MEETTCTLTQLKGMCWKENWLHFLSILLIFYNYTLIMIFL